MREKYGEQHKHYRNMENLTNEERNTLLALIEKANKPKSKVWKPKYGEEYYFIDGDGDRYTDVWDDDSDIDYNRFSIGNCFKTKEEAEFAVAKLRVIAELKRFALEHNEHDIDWNNHSQPKYCIYYGYDIKEIVTNECFCRKKSNIHFTSKEIARQAIKAIGKDRLKKYYFEVEEN